MQEKCDFDDETVIHCFNPSCIASIIGYQMLKGMVWVTRMFDAMLAALSDWEGGGYRLESSFVD